MQCAQQQGETGAGEARREAGPDAAVEGTAIQSRTPAPPAPPAPTVPATPMLGALAALTKLAAATTQSTAVAESVAPAAPPAPAIPAALLPPPQLPVNPDLQSQHPELVAQVQSLADALHKQEPGIEHWLERIHEQLRAYPELCHILTPEQVRAVCGAWMAKTQTYVVATATKARSGAKAAKLSGVKLSDDDL
jgi:hypothetical protein